MSGRRDFNEFSAKLEKHLEQLPDYAQRVQEKLQRYFPANPSQPNPLQRPVVRPPSISDVPVLAEVRAKWERWNEPAARLARRKRRASRALTLWVVLTLLCGLMAVLPVLGLIAGLSASTIVTGFAGVIVFGALGVRSGLRLHQLNRTQLPASAASLPPASSAAYEPMRRLAEGEETLAELLTQLSAPPTAVPEMSVADARRTAAEAAAALRGIAARIQAVERAHKAAPASERPALEEAVRTLREQLDDGLEGYGALIAAAGQAVAASGNGMQQSKEALTDATDRLAGLASALRELS